MLERDPELANKPLDYVLSLARAGMAEMRALIFELRPESLEKEGLVAALEKQTSAIEARHGIEIYAELGSEPDAALQVKEALYRIAQEAMHNTVKHGHATSIELTLERCAEDRLRLVIHDNGKGFDVTATFPGHLGLISMRERAARGNGAFQIESSPERGTRIVVEIPT
jgi:signal transduction histidine kinase